MPKYLVTYDLVGTDETSQDYERLIAEIQKYSWCKIQKSVFIISTSETRAKTIADALWKHMDPNDRLMVIEVAYNFAHVNSISEQSGEDWLERTFAA
ncbi:MAG TPA: CRISPR-associated endonuclease Cas2 [Nitrospiraceae bacterium]|nr:CRISPR-associated endonuclease Cas2 [Nitrospiraceae bacterium]